jgi:antirestriction protein ArdC
MNDLERSILAEFHKRSGIIVNTESEEYQGCYWRPKPNRKETLFFNPSPENFDRKMEILFHELIHATGIRLGRDMGPKGKFSAAYSYEETVAELGAMKLLQYFNLLDEEAEKNCLSYLLNHNYKLTKEERLQANLQSLEAAEYVVKHWLPDFAKAMGKVAA